MSFILGFMCGAIVGSLVSWLAYTWVQPIDVEEAGVSLFPMTGECPPCTQNCKQGDECPARSKK